MRFTCGRRVVYIRLDEREVAVLRLSVNKADKEDYE